MWRKPEIGRKEKFDCNEEWAEDGQKKLASTVPILLQHRNETY
jgi:hypothetical protein